MFDLQEIEENEGKSILTADPSYSSTVLHGLAQQLFVIRGDLVQFPISYYFRAVNPHLDIPALLPYALRVAIRGEGSENQSIAIAARMLDLAIREFLSTVAPRFSADKDLPTIELLHRLRNDHLKFED